MKIMFELKFCHFSSRIDSSTSRERPQFPWSLHDRISIENMQNLISSLFTNQINQKKQKKQNDDEILFIQVTDMSSLNTDLDIVHVYKPNLLMVLCSFFIIYNNHLFANRTLFSLCFLMKYPKNLKNSSFLFIYLFFYLFEIIGFLPVDYTRHL
jgi:hypothetical protein